MLFLHRLMWVDVWVGTALVDILEVYLGLQFILCVWFPILFRWLRWIFSVKQKRNRYEWKYCEHSRRNKSFQKINSVEELPV